MDYTRILLILTSMVLSSLRQGVQATCTGPNETPRTTRIGNKKLDNVLSGARAVIYSSIDNAAICQTRCMQYTIFSCEGFNYNTNAKECEILDKDGGSLTSLTEWDFYDFECLLPTTPLTTQPTPGTTEPAEINKIVDYFRRYPEYIAMLGMGILIILLFVTAVVILCFYTSRQPEKRYEDFGDGTNGSYPQNQYPQAGYPEPTGYPQ